jgi:DNA-binding XRE family transcriptional regulator
MKTKKVPTFQEYLDELLKKPGNKRLFDMYGKQLEIAYKINSMRKAHKISQADFAKKLGTTQSNVARMESGNQNFTTETLQKIATVFKKELKVEFV